MTHPEETQLVPLSRAVLDLRALIDDVTRRRTYELSRLSQISQAWDGQALPSEAESAEYDALIELVQMRDKHLNQLAGKLAEALGAQDCLFARAASRRMALLERSCQLSTHGWNCRRSVQSVDEAETYCVLHRTGQARKKERARRRPPEPVSPRRSVTAPRASDRPIQRHRPANVPYREPTIPILLDRIIDLEHLPPEQSVVLLTSQVDSMAIQLQSWHYASLGRRRSRRYEGYR